MERTSVTFEVASMCGCLAFTPQASPGFQAFASYVAWVASKLEAPEGVPFTSSKTAEN